MASTFSTNLKIELQTTGENSGTWGTITNTNLGTALEQAIVGYGNPSYASDANLTLTYTDTNAAQTARALVLNVTSAVSLSATRELVVPTIQKQYIVQNNTTGSQSITVKTSGGTGITVPNGRKAHLYVNGTDVIYMDDYVDINGGAIDGTPIGANSASTGSFTTLATSSTVTVNGGTANQVQYLNASKQQVGSANLTFDGTTLTAANFADSSLTSGRVTYAGASGNLTDSASLTFDGTTLATTTVDATNVEVTNIKAKDGTAAASIADSTGVISLTSNPTLSGGTANGVLYLNGSKVATSGSALTFDGIGNFINTYAAAGTGFTAKGSASGTNVDALTSRGAVLNLINTNATDGNTSAIGFYNSNELTSSYISGVNVSHAGRTGALVFGIANGSAPTEQMRLTSTGLGIGTSSPAQKLHVNGANQNILLTGSYAVSQTNQMQITNGQTISGGTGYGVALQLISDSGGNYRGAIQNVAGGTSYESLSFVSGNVGIGTSSPGNRLSISGVSASGTPTIGTYTSGHSAALTSYSADAALQFICYQSVSGSPYTKTSAIIANGDSTVPSNLQFWTKADGSSSPSLRATIDSSGNLGIGTSGPGAKLDVRSGATADAVEIGSTATTAYNSATSASVVNCRLQLFGGNATNSYTAIRFSHSGSFENFFGAVQNSGGTGEFVWGGYNGSSYLEWLRLTSSGNLGLGVTPSAWGGNFAVAQYKGGFIGSQSNAYLYIGQNAYFDGTNYKYVATAEATAYEQSAGKHIFYTAPSGTAGNTITFTQAMTLDASGQLGLGTTTPGSFGKFAVVGSSTGTLCAVRDEGTPSGNTFVVSSNANGSAIVVNSSGNVLFGKNISVGGATPTTSGTGITFPATQSASSNANTLDDYEEGTWSPVLSDGTTTASLGTGWYTKIGRLIKLSINAYNVSTSGFSTGAALKITGMPFAVSATYQIYANAALAQTTPVVSLLAESDGVTEIGLWEDSNAVDYNQFSLSDWGSPANITIRTYFFYEI